MAKTIELLGNLYFLDGVTMISKIDKLDIRDSFCVYFSDGHSICITKGACDEDTFSTTFDNKNIHIRTVASLNAIRDKIMEIVLEK